MSGAGGRARTSLAVRVTLLVIAVAVLAVLTVVVTLAINFFGNDTRSVQVPDVTYPGECFHTAMPFPNVPEQPPGAKVVGAPVLLRTLDKGRKQYNALEADRRVCAAGLKPPSADPKPAS